MYDEVEGSLRVKAGYNILMPPKRSNDGERNSKVSVHKPNLKRGKKQGREGGKRRKFPVAPPNESSGKSKRARSKSRLKIQNKMAAASDSDDKDSDLSSDDERGFFQMAESDEDTEDASETDMAKLEEEFTELKEQVYQEKLGTYKKHLLELNNGSQADYLKRLNQLEKERDDRLFLAEVCRYYEIELINKECENEKKTAKEEYESKKVELKETLLHQLNEKKRSLEAEKISMELTNDILEIKPAVTRKLRRRPNDPPPAPENNKRRRNSPAQINLLLDDSEMMADLKALNKLYIPPTEPSKNGTKANTKNTTTTNQITNSNTQVSEGPVAQYDIRIEDGKLFYDRRWYHRGQQVYVESKETGKISGVIHAIGPNEIYIKKTSDNSKLRINITQLQKAKYTIRRRSS